MMCGPFTYSMAVLPSTSFITLSAMMISVQTNSATDVGLYTVVITGTLPYGISKTMQFTLNVIGYINTAPYFSSSLKDIKSTVN
jgi:hypothetical protein